MGRTSDRIVRKAVELEAKKRLINLHEEGTGRFSKVRPPPKRKKVQKTAYEQETVEHRCVSEVLFTKKNGTLDE
jgi:hypothetical protein